MGRVWAFVRRLWRKNLVKVMVYILIIFSVASGTVMYAFRSSTTLAQSSCVARRLDGQLKRLFVGTSEVQLAVFKKQARAGALVHINKVRQGKGFFCPTDNLLGKWAMARDWLLSTSWGFRSTSRHVIIYEAVRDVFKNDKELFPAHMRCINDFAASNVRVVKRIARWASGDKPVDMIGTMRVYCTQ